MNTPGFGSPLNYKGLTVNASGKARFSGKYRNAVRMIFSETARLDLAVRIEAFANFAR